MATKITYTVKDIPRIESYLRRARRDVRSLEACNFEVDPTGERLDRADARVHKWEGVLADLKRQQRAERPTCTNCGRRPGVGGLKNAPCCKHPSEPAYTSEDCRKMQDEGELPVGLGFGGFVYR